VGSLRKNNGGSNPQPDFDLNHEGRWGWHINQSSGSTGIIKAQTKIEAESFSGGSAST
jgi:hypothetical protein